MVDFAIAQVVKNLFLEVAVHVSPELGGVLAAVLEWNVRTTRVCVQQSAGLAVSGVSDLSVSLTNSGV